MSPRVDLPVITNVRLSDKPSGAFEASAIHTGREHWYRFAQGYRDAADHLADTIEREPWRHERMAAPMLFLYRHSIELYLKSILIDSGELLDESQEVPPEHYLKRLWSKVRSTLLRISPESGGKWFDRIDAIVEDFDSLDRHSIACRYPVDREGEATLPQRFEIDVRVARQMVREACVIFDGASAQIDFYNGLKSESGSRF